MRVVLRSVDMVDFARWDSQQCPLQPWWSPQSDVSGSCDLSGGFIHPDFTYLTPGKEHPSGKPVNPYDQSVPLPKHQQCRPTTGTWACDPVRGRWSTCFRSGWPALPLRIPGLITSHIRSRAESVRRVSQGGG